MSLTPVVAGIGLYKKSQAADVTTLKNIPYWSGLTTFNKTDNAFCSYQINGVAKLFISLQDANLNHLPTDALWWKETTADQIGHIQNTDFQIIKNGVSNSFNAPVPSGEVFSLGFAQEFILSANTTLSKISLLFSANELTQNADYVLDIFQGTLAALQQIAPNYLINLLPNPYYRVTGIQNAINPTYTDIVLPNALTLPAGTYYFVIYRNDGTSWSTFQTARRFYIENGDTQAYQGKMYAVYKSSTGNTVNCSATLYDPICFKLNISGNSTTNVKCNDDGSVEVIAQTVETHNTEILNDAVNSVSNGGKITDLAWAWLGVTNPKKLLQKFTDLVNKVYTLSGGSEQTTNKDASGGYVGLTLFKINFKNAANTFTSFFTNTNTASHTYTFPDKDMIVADNADLTTHTGNGAIHVGTNNVGNTNAAQMQANTLKGNNTAALANQVDIALAVNQVLGRAAGNIQGIDLVALNDIFTNATAPNLFVDINWSNDNTYNNSTVYGVNGNIAIGTTTNLGVTIIAFNSLGIWKRDFTNGGLIDSTLGAALIAILQTDSNWNVNGDYTGATLAAYGTTNGMFYKDASYDYSKIVNNWVRSKRISKFVTGNMFTRLTGSLAISESNYVADSIPIVNGKSIKYIIEAYNGITDILYFELNVIHNDTLTTNSGKYAILNVGNANTDISVITDISSSNLNLKISNASGARAYELIINRLITG